MPAIGLPTLNHSPTGRARPHPPPLQVRTFTNGAISPLLAVLVSAGILWIADLLGGMRAVAYTGE